MPRLLFHVDEVSRERSSLRFAILSLTEADHGALLAHAKTMRTLRAARSDVCALTLYASASWYATPPFGDRTDAMIPSDTAGPIEAGPISEGVEPIEVDDERMRLDEATLMLSCTTREGVAITTEAFEFDEAISPAMAIDRRARTGDHVEWGFHMREVDGVRSPQLSVGVWFDLAPGEDLPPAIGEGTPEQRAAIEAAIEQLRAAIGRT